MVKLRRYFFCCCENAKNLGRSDAKRRKKEDGLTKVCDIMLHEFKQKIRAHELESLLGIGSLNSYLD